jgi:hypothetical protein
MYETTWGCEDRILSDIGAVVDVRLRASTGVSHKRGDISRRAPLGSFHVINVSFGHLSLAGDDRRFGTALNTSSRYGGFADPTRRPFIGRGSVVATTENRVWLMFGVSVNDEVKHLVRHSIQCPTCVTYLSYQSLIVMIPPSLMFEIIWSERQTLRPMAQSTTRPT